MGKTHLDTQTDGWTDGHAHRQKKYIHTDEQAENTQVDRWQRVTDKTL